jgi:hypothetical protein
VAERGLVFVQNFLSLLAEKEAAGQLRPWFKEVRQKESTSSVLSVLRDESKGNKVRVYGFQVRAHLPVFKFTQGNKRCST